MEKAILVTVWLEGESPGWSAEDARRELRELAVSCGIDPAGEIIWAGKRPDPRAFLGSGKVSELAREAARLAPDVAIVGRDLSGSQQRNLEEAIGIKTIDRTQLILDVFARHARSLEGKVQVELAQLGYLLPRLAGKGILLSRLGGGIGTRGPGEQKLEIDRRRIRRRIQDLKRDLEKLAERRAAYRLRRSESALPSVALVGYTNAGKSTLFNAFTEAGALVEDRLFSTLDPTARRFVLPNRQKVLFIDTVGFLHRLPHHLVDAFRATLEEVRSADLLLHVVDVSDPKARARERSVTEVLELLGAARKRKITVLNKADRLEGGPAALDRIRTEWPGGLVVSALRREGLGPLAALIAEEFKDRSRTTTLFFPAGTEELLSQVYDAGSVTRRQDLENGTEIEALLPNHLAAMMEKRLGSKNKF